MLLPGPQGRRHFTLGIARRAAVDKERVSKGLERCAVLTAVERYQSPTSTWRKPGRFSQEAAYDLLATVFAEACNISDGPLFKMLG